MTSVPSSFANEGQPDPFRLFLRKAQLPTRFPRLRLRGLSLPFYWIVFLFGPVALLLALIGWGVWKGVGTTFRERMQEDVELIARSIQRPITYSLERGRPGSVVDTLKAAFVFDRLYGAFLYDTQGNLLAKAGEGSPAPGRIARSPEIALRDDSGGGYDLALGDEETFSFFVPLRAADGQRIGLLQVTRSEEEMRAALAAIRERLLLGYVAVCVFLIVLLALVHETFFARPLRRLQATILRIESGSDWDRAPALGPREWTELSRGFNRMLDAIEAREREISRKEMEGRELRRRLDEAEKLATLGEMAASIGHEIGTPLSTMDGIAQRALRQTDEDPARNHFQTIREQIRRIENFVRHLLTLGRSEGGPSTGDLVEAARLGVLDLDDDRQRAAVSLEVPPQPDSVRVGSDPLRLRIAFRNLLENALRSRAGTRVRIVIGRADGDAVCRIEDDGPGVPPELQQRIFEPFVSGRADGTGVGLSLVSRIVEEAGGQISLDSSPESGSRFTLRFPLAPLELK